MVNNKELLEVINYLTDQTEGSIRTFLMGLEDHLSRKGFLSKKQIHAILKIWKVVDKRDSERRSTYSNPFVAPD